MKMPVAIAGIAFIIKEGILSRRETGCRGENSIKRL